MAGAMAAGADFFGGVEKTTAKSNRDYIDPGFYPKVRVEEVRAGTTRAGAKFLVAELTILEAAEGSRNRKGQRVSFMRMLAEELGMRDARQFVATCLGVEFDKVNAAAMAKACDPEKQPLRGIELCADARHKPTKKGGNFTEVKFTLVTE